MQGHDSERETFGELFGRSPAMRALFAESDRLAQTDTPLCVYGEAGAGKDALARAVHRSSPRSQGPLVSVDCSTLPLAKLERELFGLEGVTRHPSAVALAQGGTLLLDRVGELPAETQLRLADALLTTPLALDDATPRPARTIALNQRPLTHERERGKFRPELYARLAGAELTIPPLRERREDLPALAQHLLTRIEEARGIALTADVLELLSLHDWPGNVRELRNVIERFVYALRKGELGARRFAAIALTGSPVSLERRPVTAEPAMFEPGASYRDERARFEGDFERRYVSWLLDRHDGNVSAAARAAEMDRKYLDKLARKHGLKASR
jgi:DNA-binding NtrC family response regulator